METIGKNESSLNQLKLKLEKAGIDTSKWGTGQAKTLSNLLKEIEEGETILIEDAEGKLLRKLVVGQADIYYTAPDGKKYRLKEEKQIFKDGRERKRDLGHAVSGKMKVGESPEDSTVREIKEELGIEGEVSLVKGGEYEETLSSPSYPGLQSQYVRYSYKVVLNEKQFRPEGYKEEQEGLTTYFIWEQVK